MCAVPKKRKVVSLKNTSAYNNYKKQQKQRKHHNSAKNHQTTEETQPRKEKRQKQTKAQPGLKHKPQNRTPQVAPKSAAKNNRPGKVKSTVNNAGTKTRQAVNRQKANIQKVKKANSGHMHLSQDIGIDLGTTSIKVFVKGRGVVFNEPAVVAIGRENKEIVAVGNAARLLLEKGNEDIEAIRPIREGTIADYEVSEKMLKYFIEQACGRNWIIKPRIMLCTHTDNTKVEEKSIRQIALQSGARQAYLMDKAMAAAIGAGLNVHSTSGDFIVDIGGGTTDIAIIALDGTICGRTIRIGGDNFNESIIKYIRRDHNLLIGEHCAEDIKCSIGTAIINDYNKKDFVKVTGKDTQTGKQKTITYTAKECNNALMEELNKIINAINDVLELAPPEITADIIAKGMVLTGGSARLNNLALLISKKTLIHVSTAENPECSVALGTGRALEFLGRYSSTGYFARKTWK